MCSAEDDAMGLDVKNTYHCPDTTPKIQNTTLAGDKDIVL